MCDTVQLVPTIQVVGVLHKVSLKSNHYPSVHVVSKCIWGLYPSTTACGYKMAGRQAGIWFRGSCPSSIWWGPMKNHNPCTRRCILQSKLHSTDAVQINHDHGKRSIIDTLNSLVCAWHDKMRWFMKSVATTWIVHDNDVYMPPETVCIWRRGTYTQGDDNININTELLHGNDTYHSMASFIFQTQNLEASWTQGMEQFLCGNRKSLHLSNAAVIHTM